MKKNDFMGLIVYALMIAIAVFVGISFIRPTFATSGNSPFGNGIVFMVFTMIIAIILNSVLLEVGHIIGARIGGYKVLSVNCLYFRFKRGSDDKFKFSFASFDGLTGETLIRPNDVKKSNPTPYLYFPLLFLLLEVILGVILVVIATVNGTSSNGFAWWRTFAIVIIAVGFMVYLYDYFPAKLDAKNDGYLFPILTNQTNKEAYNHILHAEYLLSIGEPAPESPIYDSVTDFTAKINDITLYRYLSEKNYEGAISVAEKTIACEKAVSSNVYYDAVCQKLAVILLIKPLEEARKYYVAMKLDAKKYIRGLTSAPAVRAYLLVSGLIEESIAECKEALDASEDAVNKSGSDKKTMEDKLISEALAVVKAAHPDWDFSEYIDGEESSEAPAPAEEESDED